MTSVRTVFKTDKLEARLRGVGDAKGLKGFAGIMPKDANLPYKNGATVIDVARWTELGTPNAPARPFMRRARARAQRAMRLAIQKAAREEFQSSWKPVKILAAGLKVLSDEVVSQIDTASAWAEALAESTVKRKGHDIPLIETRLLREVQSWEIRKRGAVVARGRPVR